MASDAPAAPLVLSLFPGIGLLDQAFEEAGFCVVLPPFTTAAKVKAIGNGVPLAMGRAVAQAVARAMESPRG